MSIGARSRVEVSGRGGPTPACHPAPVSPALVIFDCDGTLVDSETVHRRELAATVTALGVPTTPEQVVERYAGAAFATIDADVASRLGRPAPDGWLAAFSAHRARVFEREGVAQIPGARDAVTAVQAAGIPTCVASQGALEKTAMTLRLSGLADLFPDVRRFSAAQVPHGKPAPDLFLHAAAALGAPPERCLVVEDTPLGVRGAVAAGMRVLGLALETPAADLAAAGAEVIGALDEVVGRLEA